MRTLQYNSMNKTWDIYVDGNLVASHTVFDAAISEFAKWAEVLGKKKLTQSTGKEEPPAE